jgi:hypothetical protein
MQMMQQRSTIRRINSSGIESLPEACESLHIETCDGEYAPSIRRRRPSIIVPMPPDSTSHNMAPKSFTLGNTAELANKNPRLRYQPGVWNRRTGLSNVVVRLEINAPIDHIGARRRRRRARRMEVCK